MWEIWRYYCSLRGNQEDASEKKNEHREELYEELFGISQFSDDGGGDDESDVHKKCVFPDSFKLIN